MEHNQGKVTEISVGNHDLAKTPLIALSDRSRELLAGLLNQRRIFTSEEGYFRDWRGAFDVIGVPKRFLALVENNASPAKCLLELWDQESANCKRPANLAQLQEVLGCIDRWDVVDDTSKSFEEDAVKFLLKKQTSTRVELKQPTDDLEDMDIITRDDTHEHKQQYDAFILYADQDIEFASKLVTKLEKRGMRLCLRDRDILAGGNCEHAVLIRLITERCRRLVVLISQAFLESPLYTFTVTFAHALQIEKRQRKVIPCVIEKCEVPQHLKFTFMLDYLRQRELFNFWDKLTDSVRDPAKIAKPESVSGELKETKVAPTVIVEPEPVKQRPAASKHSPVPEKQTKHVASPALTVQIPTVPELAKKSNSFWDRVSAPFHLTKGKLSRSTSQLTVSNANSTALAKDCNHDEQQALSSLSLRSSSTLALAENQKVAKKSKRKWYKSFGQKIATTG
ncbi:myeloid differentiation primary response protein MyD88-like [Anopheles darlingi]|uniref:myeloid differentiation primary response protein MyD88-like n=1 Tax=Anopheles darlingi TaxID=43151 RepID=UPI0021001280|nr:myeloid differentiation primary response protein MyD88-like [Anopheles darlingi]